MKSEHDSKQSQIEALLPAYVLGALSGDESHAVDEYIRQQRDFLARLQKLEDSTALLTHISTPVTPAPNVRRTIFMIARLDAPSESIATTLPVSVGTAIQPYHTHGKNGHNTNGHSSNGHSPNGHSANGYSNGSNGTSPVAYAITPYRPEDAAPTRRVQPITIHAARRQRVTLRLWQVAALAALLALIAIATIGLLLNRQLNWALTQSSLSQSKLETLMTTNNQLLVEKESLVSQNQQLLKEQTQSVGLTQQQFNTIAGAEQATALRSVGGSSVTAQAMLYRTNSGFAIAASGLPELTPDRTYQLWLIDAQGTAKPLAVFTAQSSENILWRQFDYLGSNFTYNAVALSIEQIGGSASPTTVVMHSTR